MRVGLGGLIAALAGGCLGASPGSSGLDGGSDGDSDSGPADGGGGADATPCGDALVELVPFADDFNDEGAGLPWAEQPVPMTDGAGAIEVVVGGAQLGLKPGAPAPDHAWVKSVSFSFGSARVAVEVPLLSTQGGVESYLALVKSGVDRRIRFDGGTILANTGAIAYDPEDHRWWQLRSEAGRLHYELSADGVTWELLDDEVIDFSLDELHVQIGVQVTVAGNAERGVFTLDNLNLPPCR